MHIIQYIGRSHAVGLRYVQHPFLRLVVGLFGFDLYSSCINFVPGPDQSLGQLVWAILNFMCKYIYFRSTPHPVTVTTRIITFLVGNPYKPSFATVTGWGVVPTYIIYELYMYMYTCISHLFTCHDYVYHVQSYVLQFFLPHTFQVRLRTEQKTPEERSVSTDLSKYTWQCEEKTRNWVDFGKWKQTILIFVVLG